MTTSSFRTLRANRVGFRFPAQRDIDLLADVTFSVERGQIVVVMGSSGCGKSTLLRVLASLAAPTAGAVEAPAVDLKDGPSVTLVHQELGLFDWLTAIQQIELLKHSRRGLRQDAAAWLRRFGIAEAKDKYPHQLSGGMRQRLALARGFAAEAPFLLLDEPFSQLDVGTELAIIREFVGMVAARNVGAIVVTHSPLHAAAFGDAIHVLGARPATIVETLVPVISRTPGHCRSDDQVVATAVALNQLLSKWTVR